MVYGIFKHLTQMKKVGLQRIVFLSIAFNLKKLFHNWAINFGGSKNERVFMAEVLEP